MTKCFGTTFDFDDFTTYDFTTFTTLRLVIDIETGFTVQNEFLDRLQVAKLPCLIETFTVRRDGGIMYTYISYFLLLTFNPTGGPRPAGRGPLLFSLRPAGRGEFGLRFGCCRTAWEYDRLASLS